MKQKINDTNASVSVGGRLRNYWDERGVKQHRSSFVPFEEDVDLKALIKKYKLHGFEFGRYVNNEDRYDFVLATKDSLRDLAWMLKTDNLGVNYKIGIAFGARGRGGHAIAHYEPLLNMINLTKNKGGQSMAHEYGHALDYNIGMYVDQNKSHGALSAGRSMAKFPEDNTGGTCRLLMRKLIREIKMTDSFKRLEKASDYWHYNTEVFARYFEQWCCYTLRAAKQSNGFLAKAWTVYTTKPQYLTEADFKKVLPTGDKLMKNIGLVLNGKKTEPYMELEVTNPEKVKKAAAPKKEPVKKAATPKKDPVKKAAADPFANMKTLPEKIRDRYYAGEITMRQAAEEFHKAGYDTHVDMEATRKRIGVRPASKKLAEKAAGKTAPKATPKKVAQKAAKAAAAGKAVEKLAYQDYDKAFKALAKFTEKNPVRSSLATVYHGGGDMVATDAHVLAVIHNAKYPKAKEGKMVLARKITYEDSKKKKITGTPGQILPGKYPNYNPVLPTANKLDSGTVIVIDDELAKAKKHLEMQKRLQAEARQAKKKGYSALYDWEKAHPEYQMGRVPYPFKKFHVSVDLLIRCLEFMKAAGAKTVFYHDNMSPTNRAGVFRSGNLEALIMPVMKND